MIKGLRKRWVLPVRHRRQKRYWVRPCLTQAEWKEKGQYTSLMPRLELDDPMAYQNFIQMPLKSRSSDSFLSSRGRGPDSRSEVDSQPQTPGQWKQLPHPAVCLLIDQVEHQQVTCTTLPEDWLEIASVFRQRWKIPHALGALDGKYIPIRCPQWGGSLYHNYKGFHSIILLALVDGDYKFLWVDIGTAGSSSDARFFKHSNLRNRIEDGSIGFPESESLGIGGPKVNFFILGDTFPLKLWLTKPYSGCNMDLPERIFNYRISRGRTVVENP